MSTAAPGPRAANPRRLKTPPERGQPDPRPLTEYTVVLSTVAGDDRLTVTLGQPCVIRHPAWAAIDCTDGSLVYPSAVDVIDNTTFVMKFTGTLGKAIGFVQVPYQDMQVQNFQGGFVRPGGQWFRKPM